MAKRKNDLKDGWQAQFSGQIPQGKTGSTSEYQRKTYLLKPDQVERIKTIAEDNGVQVNELVRFLLEHVLGEFEAGKITLPLETVYKIKQQ
jgi:hypothetical protein